MFDENDDGDRFGVLRNRVRNGREEELVHFAQCASLDADGERVPPRAVSVWLAASPQNAKLGLLPGSRTGEALMLASPLAATGFVRGAVAEGEIGWWQRRSAHDGAVRRTELFQDFAARYLIDAQAYAAHLDAENEHDLAIALRVISSARAYLIVKDRTTGAHIDVVGEDSDFAIGQDFLLSSDYKDFIDNVVSKAAFIRNQGDDFGDALSDAYERRLQDR